MSTKRERERRIFGAFVESAPMFAGDAIATWTQPEDEKEFPDVVAITVSGRRIGVELAEWLNQAELENAKRKESFEERVLLPVRDLPNVYAHIGKIWFHPLSTPPKAPPPAAFREELVACLAKCDAAWPSERFWHSPQGALIRAERLKSFPALAAYLSSMTLFPKRDGDSPSHWIWFPARADAFDENTMFRPLLTRVAEKIHHYSTGPTGLDEIALVVFYENAWAYNSPAETPWFSFGDAAAKLSIKLRPIGFGVFSKVFLLIATSPKQVFPITLESSN